MPDVAETSTGWIAVTWLESFQLGDTLYSQENLRWVSPADALGPVIRPDPSDRSYPAAVSLAAVGARTVLVLINPEAPNNRIYAERVDAPGHAGPRTRAVQGHEDRPARDRHQRHSGGGGLAVRRRRLVLGLDRADAGRRRRWSRTARERRASARTAPG